MRDIFEVMNAVLNIIPEDLEERENIEKDLKHLIDSVYYTAPEAMSDRWYQFSGILERRLPANNVNTEWGKLLLRVFNGEVGHKEYCKIDHLKKLK